MAVQIDRMNVILTMVRNLDGTYAKTVAGVEAICNDPVGANPTAKAPRNVSEIVKPVYSGVQTCDGLTDAAFANAKTAAGIA